MFGPTERFEYASDFDTTKDLKGAFTFIEEGSFAGRGYVVTSTNGSNGIDFSWISQAARPNTGNGLDYNPAENVISLKTASNSTLGGIKVGTNLEIDTDGVLSAIAGSVGRDNEIITNNYTEHYLWNFYEEELLKNPSDNSTSTDNLLIFTNKNINIPTEFTYIGELVTNNDIKYLSSNYNGYISVSKFASGQKTVKYFLDQLTNIGDKFTWNINFAYSNAHLSTEQRTLDYIKSRFTYQTLALYSSSEYLFARFWIKSSARWTLRFPNGTNWFEDSRTIKSVSITTEDQLEISWNEETTTQTVEHGDYLITNDTSNGLPNVDAIYSKYAVDVNTGNDSATLRFYDTDRVLKDSRTTVAQQKIFSDAVITSNTNTISLANFIENSIEITLYKKINYIWTFRMKWFITNSQTGITETSTEYFNLNTLHESFVDPSSDGIYEDNNVDNLTKKFIRKMEFILEKTPKNSEYIPINNSGIDSMNLRNYAVQNKNIANNSISANKLDFHRVQGYWEMSALDTDPSLNNYKILNNLNENYPNLYLTTIGQKISEDNSDYLYLNSRQYRSSIDFDVIAGLQQISIPNLPDTNDYLLEEGDYVEHTYEIASSIQFSTYSGISRTDKIKIGNRTF